jgi:hypothetical protein
MGLNMQNMREVLQLKSYKLMLGGSYADGVSLPLLTGYPLTSQRLNLLIYCREYF